MKSKNFIFTSLPCLPFGSGLTGFKVEGLTPRLSLRGALLTVSSALDTKMIPKTLLTIGQYESPPLLSRFCFKRAIFDNQEFTILFILFIYVIADYYKSVKIY